MGRVDDAPFIGLILTEAMSQIKDMSYTALRLSRVTISSA